MELTSRVSGEKEAQICKVGVCACIIGPERNTARSSRTNGQWSEHYESIKKKKKQPHNIHMHVQGVLVTLRLERGCCNGESCQSCFYSGMSSDLWSVLQSF